MQLPHWSLVMNTLFIHFNELVDCPYLFQEQVASFLKTNKSCQRNLDHRTYNLTTTRFGQIPPTPKVLSSEMAFSR